jgi:hypothetical protein
LPKPEQDLSHWQIATACLIDTAEGRDFLLHARVGVLRAVNAGQPNPDVTPRGKKSKAYRLQNEPDRPQDRLRHAGDRGSTGHLAVSRIALKARRRKPARSH